MDKPRALLTAGRRLRGFLALAVLPAFATAAVVHGQCQYEVTGIIQGPNCFITGPQPTFAQGMNVHGHVVGYYWDCLDAAIRHAFVWKPETGLVTLPMPEEPTSARAVDINDHGMVIGAHSFTGVGWKAWVFDPQTQEYTYLEPLHEGATATDLTVANAINNSNVVAGARVISKPGDPIVRNAVIWDTNTGDVIDLGVMNGPNSAAVDINEHGDAIGWSGTAVGTSNNRAILWIDGVGQDLGVLPGLSKAVSKHLNNHTEVVGVSNPPTGLGLHFYWVAGKMLPLNPPRGFDHVATTDLSDARQMVGRMRVEGTNILEPFLWQHDKYHNLASLLVGMPDNATMSHGSVLASNGSIVARGTLSGKTVGILLTPIDVPFADFNFDCKVDVHDLLELLLNWGPNPGSKYDLTGNGVVNVFDLLALLANWG